MVGIGVVVVGIVSLHFFFFQAEDGIRYLVRSRGLGDVYKRQGLRQRALGGADRLPGAARPRLPLLAARAGGPALRLSLIHI